MADYIGNYTGEEIDEAIAEVATKVTDKGNHITVNGIDVYFSTVQPTGNIAEGSVGFGW